jgi:hypothetical protein
MTATKLRRVRRLKNGEFRIMFRQFFKFTASKSKKKSGKASYIAKISLPLSVSIAEQKEVIDVLIKTVPF